MNEDRLREGKETVQFNVRLDPKDDKKIVGLVVAMTMKTGQIYTRSDVVRMLIRKARTL